MSAGAGQWQLHAAAGLGVVVALLLAVLAGGYIEWARAGGVRDLAQQLDAVREQALDYWQAAEEALAAAGRWREAADAEHRRADRCHNRMLLALQEQHRLRRQADDQVQAAGRVAEVVDLALWMAEHEPPVVPVPP